MDRSTGKGKLRNCGTDGRRVNQIDPVFPGFAMSKGFPNWALSSFAGYWLWGCNAGRASIFAAVPGLRQG